MKEKLLSAVDQGVAREAEIEALAVDEPADPDGRWHAKDHLAHISWWRRRTAATVNAVRTGGELPPPVDDDDDVTNAMVYAQVKDLPAADVKADARDSWAALRQAILDCSEEDLTKPHPRRPGSQVWEMVPGSIGHTGTHVWSWLLDVGDETRAMEVARWNAELEARFFTTPEQLASSWYNLACVYARLGKPEEALPLLRQSFKAMPELIGFARKDHDLDPIREELAPILL